MRPGPRNLITDVPGLRIGNAHDRALRSGTTVLTADQPLRHAGRHRRLEQLAEHVAVAEAPMPVLREGRVIRNRAVEPQPAEPTIGEVQMDLFT